MISDIIISFGEHFSNFIGKIGLPPISPLDKIQQVMLHNIPMHFPLNLAVFTPLSYPSK